MIWLLLISSCLAAPIEDLVDPQTYQKFSIPYAGDWYSGYLKITEQKQFHYFLFPSALPNAPIILWLNGGPGCSSLTGALIEHGPFVFASGTDQFMANEWAWNQFAHMLYLETPASVGYSFGDDTTSDELSAKDNLIAVQQFLAKFPEYKDTDLYIAGESYAGIYIPNLVHQILIHNEQDGTQKIKITGIMIGNGCTDPTECTVEAKYFPVHKFDFLRYHNFIDDKLYQKVQAHRETCYNNQSKECADIYAEIDQQTNGDGQFKHNPYNFYGPCYEPPITVDGENMEYSKNIRDPYDLKESHIPPCADAKGQYKYLRNQEFMDAIHILPQSNPWGRCNSLKYTKDPRASYYLYADFIRKGIKILKFSGDVDGVVPITGTLYWINKLQLEHELPTLEAWRPWYKGGAREGERQNAGNVWVIDGLTFVSIRNAGHMVPADQREAAHILISNFITNTPLPTE